MISIENRITRIKKYLPDLNEERVLKAFEVAKTCHSGQKRASGVDYIIHPLSVVDILIDYQPDEDTIIAALLHDVTEDSEMTFDEVKKEFGTNVAKLVDGMEKLSRIQATGEARQVGSLRKMFLAMAKDIRVVLIKLADRLHNMQTLHFMREDKQQRIAQETLTIYAPIAARLGIYKIKGPLEDLAFFYLEPEEYMKVAEQMKKHEPYRTRILKNAKKALNELLKKENIKGEIMGRIKHFYSIHKKLKRQHKDNVDELYDIFALRIVVPNIHDCYSVLGRIHQYWTPLAKRFKDYIAVPKPNNYRSLHTTVIGLTGIKSKSMPIELQIRTYDMQREAEFGIAAHWAYKEGKSKIKANFKNKSNWVKSLVIAENSIKDNASFMQNLQIDTFSDRIFTLTPGGDIKDLPKDATPIDFAFAIHTDVGTKTKSAKVNGKIVPLDYFLQNGDVVEIITTRNSEPHQNWLSFVKTSAARNRIRRHFKSQDRDKIIRDGKEILNKQLLRFGLPKLGPHLQILKKYNKKRLSIQEREEILERIGNGSLSVAMVIKKLIKKKDQKPERLRKTSFTSNIGKKIGEVLIAGEKEIPVRIADCCKPKEGQLIVGFVTRGGHITIHRRDCKILQKLDHDRFVEAKWISDPTSKIVSFILETNSDRVGLLRDAADVFVKHNINLESVDVKRKTPVDVEIIFQAKLDDFKLITHLMDKLENIDGVGEVRQRIE